jgi:hypothetical protein
MKHAVEMGSGAMTYRPSFIKIFRGIQKFGGGRIEGQTAYFYFFQNKESRLKGVLLVLL